MGAVAPFSVLTNKKQIIINIYIHIYIYTAIKDPLP